MARSDNLVGGDAPCSVTRRFAFAVGLAYVFPASATGAIGPRVTFDTPTQVSANAAYQAAEPSIRVDAPSATQRIWIAAPSGIGVNTRSLPANPLESGELFWYSD